jgi:HAD superfamily hydrolase (TIGR01509 family)
MRGFMIKALVFDFDGVITDTEPVHMDAWLGVFEPLGISFGEDEYRAQYLGLNDRDFLDAVGRMHGHHFSAADKANLIEQKAMAVMTMLEHDIPLLPGVREFVEEAKKTHLLAICSGAGHGEIEFILHRLKWEGVFSPIVAAESVTKGKPDPEGYIRALEGLQKRATELLLSDETLAVEDSPKGIAATKAAGLRCLAVSNSYPDAILKDADRVVSSLAEFDLAEAVSTESP